MKTDKLIIGLLAAAILAAIVNTACSFYPPSVSSTATTQEIKEGDVYNPEEAIANKIAKGQFKPDSVHRDVKILEIFFRENGEKYRIFWVETKPYQETKDYIIHHHRGECVAAGSKKIIMDYLFTQAEKTEYQ